MMGRQKKDQKQDNWNCSIITMMGEHLTREWRQVFLVYHPDTEVFRLFIWLILRTVTEYTSLLVESISMLEINRFC